MIDAKFRSRKFLVAGTGAVTGSIALLYSVIINGGGAAEISAYFIGIGILLGAYKWDSTKENSSGN